MSLGLSIGMRALLSAKTVMEMIGHNLANQNTPGYSRQVALLQTTNPTTGPRLLPLGTGVVVGNIFSVRNESLLSRIRIEAANAGRYDTEASMLSQLEAILGDLTDSSLSDKMQAVFDSADEAATKPEDQVLRQNLLSSISELALGFRLRDEGIESQMRTSVLQAQSLVTDVNSKLQRVAELNTKITSQVALGVTPGDLLDQRSVLLESLADTLGAQSYPLANGAVAVSVAGTTLVTGSNASSLQSYMDADGRLHLTTGKGGLEVVPTQGKLGAMIHMSAEYLPDRLDDLDTIARALILNMNRIHARGIPGSGPFTQLKSSNPISVAQGLNPLALNLEDLGLPFEMKDGAVSIAITNKATGDVTRHDVAIDPANMTLQDLLDGLNSVPHLTAFVDGAGKLTMKADSGYGFDFSQRLDAVPVEGGTFGSENAVIAGGTFPAALTNGSTLQLAVDGGAAQTITFNATDFANIGAATAAEVAAVINTQATGVTASVVDGRLVIGSNTTGTNSSLAITDGAGAPAAALGIPLTASGASSGVSVSVSGSSASAGPDTFTFKPTGDGQIGVTPNLGIEVYDGDGKLVTTLQVGEGYEPGDDLEVVEGVFVSFGAGSVSGSAGQFFDLEIPGDTDTADFLPAFGLNAVLQGKDAATIDLADGIAKNPNLLAGASFGGPGDGGNFLALGELSTMELAELDGSSLLHRYNGFASEVGAASAGANESFKATALVLLTLETQRANESGVSPDEELLNLERFQDAYEAAGRYLSVMTDLNDVLLNI
jgi:flagellar hook-associated protein FlgK